MRNRIFSFDSPKAIKADKFGYLNAIHYMAPYDVAGVGNLCPKATEGCRALCLGLWSGQAGMVKRDNTKAQGNEVRASRVAKAKRFMHNRADYLLDVVRSIDLAILAAKRKRRKLCVRLNGSTDIAWEGIRFLITRNANGRAMSVELNPFGHSMMEHYHATQFVDYTKIASRFTRRALPSNLHLTLSRSESNESECIEALARGVNVAVVFGTAKPTQWHGFDVIDGDMHDLRHLDPRGTRGVVVALSPKGRKAKRDQSGFVVR